MGIDHRFDSAGPAHRNRDVDTSLVIQVVTTPHFQFYNESGINIAYKTDKLKNDDFVNTLLSSLDEGLSHFCSETKCELLNSRHPTVDVYPDTLTFPTDNKDPLSGIKF